MRKHGCIAVIVFLMTMFFHGQTLAKDSDVVAKIGEKKITVADFERILGYVDTDRQKLFEQNPQLKETLLNQIVQSTVISDLARKKGFDNRTDVKEQLKIVTDNFLANEYLKREIANKITVSESEMKSYYEAHKDEFKIPEMVKASHILVRMDASSSEDDRKKAREKAENILKKIKSGENFAKLASEMSEDPGSKTKGGDLGFFPRGRMIKPFEEIAFSMKPGETSDLVETQFGYHIIKVEEKKEASVETFNAAKERINQKLSQDQIKTKVAEFIETTMKDAAVEMHPEILTGEGISK